MVVRLDPGLAFGTGTHPTTALCLEWLDALDLAGKSVIDYGCGSGVLAIAALKLGAAHVVGVDNDPQALTASRDNAERNGVAEQMDLHLPEDFPQVHRRTCWSQTSWPGLSETRAALRACESPAATLALSGILRGQETRTLRALRAMVRGDRRRSA